MLRSGMAVIVGYIVMTVIAVPIFLGAYVVPDLVWEKDAARTTLGFNLLTLVAGLVGALVGGFVCQLVARQRGKPPVVLAVLVLLMGLSLALIRSVTVSIFIRTFSSRSGHFISAAAASA